MPTSVEALAVIVAFVVPGAIYQWSYERQAGSAWTHGLGDRILRFVRTSTVVHALLAPLTLALYHSRLEDLDGRWPRFSWALYIGVLAALALPALLGTAHGNLQQRLYFERLPHLGGPTAPTAWDHLFSRNQPGWVRAQLKATEAWVGGVYLSPEGGDAVTSLASGHPHPRDLLLTKTISVGDDGDYILDERGNVTIIEQSLLLRWNELVQLIFEPFPRGER